MREHDVGVVFDPVAVHIEEVQQKGSILLCHLWLHLASKYEAGFAPFWPVPFHASTCDSVAPRTTTPRWPMMHHTPYPIHRYRTCDCADYQNTRCPARAVMPYRPRAG